MKNSMIRTLFLGVILCHVQSIMAQTTGLNGATFQVGLSSINPEEFNSTVFPRLESWGMGDERINRMTTFTVLSHEQKNRLDYGLYGSYAFAVVRGEATYFSSETVLNTTPAHVGETNLSIQRFSLGIHLGTDVLQCFSKSEELRFEWIVRGRAGFGTSSVSGRVDRYSLLNRSSEIEVNRASSLFLEGQLDMEIAYQLGEHFRIGAFASLLYSRAPRHKLGELTRRPEDSNRRVRFDYSGFTAGLLFGVQF